MLLSKYGEKKKRDGKEADVDGCWIEFIYKIIDTNDHYKRILLCCSFIHVFTMYENEINNDVLRMSFVEVMLAGCLRLLSEKLKWINNFRWNYKGLFCNEFM